MKIYTNSVMENALDRYNNLRSRLDRLILQIFGKEFAGFFEIILGVPETFRSSLPNLDFLRYLPPAGDVQFASSAGDINPIISLGPLETRQMVDAISVGDSNAVETERQRNTALDQVENQINELVESLKDQQESTEGQNDGAEEAEIAVTEIKDAVEDMREGVK